MRILFSKFYIMVQVVYLQDFALINKRNCINYVQVLSKNSFVMWEGGISLLSLYLVPQKPPADNNITNLLIKFKQSLPALYCRINMLIYYKIDMNGYSYLLANSFF